MNKHLQQVKHWSEVFQRFISPAPTTCIPQDQKEVRIKLLKEELKELEEAIQNNDLVEIADAIGDLQFLLHGTALAFGLHNYIDEINDEVYKSNMTKLKEDGTFDFREDGKILKPSTFEPPDLRSILFPEIKKTSVYRLKEGPFCHIDLVLGKHNTFSSNPNEEYIFLNKEVLFSGKANDETLGSLVLRKDELWKVYEYKS